MGRLLLLTFANLVMVYPQNSYAICSRNHFVYKLEGSQKIFADFSISRPTQDNKIIPILTLYGSAIKNRYYFMIERGNGLSDIILISLKLSPFIDGWTLPKPDDRSDRLFSDMSIVEINTNHKFNYNYWNPISKKFKMNDVTYIAIPSLSKNIWYENYNNRILIENGLFRITDCKK